jgi:hypothetical protein
MLGAAAAILGDGTTFTLTTSNPGAPGVTPEFPSFSAFSDAITEARIDLGFHFRTACVLGQRMGYAVADQILRNALAPLPGSGTINVAVRGRAGPGDDALIAGFHVAAGTRPALIRATGPALAMFHVEGALPDPSLVVFDSSGRQVAGNDNWSSGTPAETAAVNEAMMLTGAFPLPNGSRDAALVVSLPAGSYTVHASGVADAAGTALLEILELP